MTNAIRAAPSGSEVTVTARRHKGDIAVSLTLSHDAPQLALFEDIGIREPGAARQALGMAMVRAVVEIHGGRVETDRDAMEVTCILPAGDSALN